MENMKKFNFECLAFDTDNSSTIISKENLLHSILSNGSIWEKETPDLDLSNMKINDGDNFCLTIENVDTDQDIYSGNSKAFLLKIEGTFQKLEPRRIQILKHMKKEFFNYLYVLVDEISQNIAEELYSLIYQVENNLRAFLTRFMTIKIGPEWWKNVVPKKVEDTVKNRTNNEKNFRDFIKNEIYLMDFSDLGRCIYSYSSGGIKTKEDLVNKILIMEKTLEAISELKEQVKSNQEKFFEDSFKNKNFQSQWEELTNIRNKVAHNNLFIIDDLERGKNLSDNLLSIIKEANENIKNIPFSAEEREMMIENFASPVEEVATEETAKIVTEETFLEKLQKQEEYMKSTRPNGFVGISYFINKFYSEREGYNRFFLRKLIRKLEEENKIKIHRIENPNDKENPTTVIETVK